MINKKNFLIKNNFFNKHLISLDQFNTASLKTIFNLTEKIRKMEPKQLIKILAGKMITLLFFEPSSRTFSSFATAVKRLGGQTIEYQNPLQTSSAVKGETLEDTIKVLENYCDLIIIRHPQVGAAQTAAESTMTIPVINAGDGIGEHPTQALLDLYTIDRHHRRLDSLKGLLVGDLLNGRTIHSLIKGLSFYKNNTLCLLSPKQLRVNKEDFNKFSSRGVRLIEIESEKQIPHDCHFWYWTRVQKERFKNIKEYEALKHRFILKKKLVEEKGNRNLILMHPLPRVGEIELAVDQDKRAIYLNEQVKNGMWVRMALLTLILKK